MNSIITKIRKTMFPETWCVAYRKIENDKECLLYNKEKPFTVLPNTKSLWCADPFLFEKDGALYIFFEVLDYIKRKGLIGYRQLTDSGFGEITVIYEGDNHLSFPFIYEEDDNVYIIPESAHDNCLFRLKCTDFPDKWEYDKTLIEEKLVDTVLYNEDGTNIYITERVVTEGVFDRLDIFVDNEGVIKEFASNPVKTEAANARGAGCLFRCDGDLIRPSQDCSSSYGGKLNFNKIITLSESEFQEECIATVSAEEIKTDSDRTFCGIHTYNRLGNYEVIDLKLPARFSMRNTVGAVFKLFKGVLK